ncbi:hypothetical protein AAC387_Pa03g4309 [Persea americana]
MAVQIAKAIGHHVTVISSSDRKREEALEHLSADAFLVSSDEAQMRGAQGRLNYILDTIPAVHSLEPYLSLLKVDGKLLLVGATKPLQFDPVSVMLGRKTITGSFIGSMEETRAVGVLGREGSDVNDRGGEDGLREHCNGENGKERRQV